MGWPHSLLIAVVMAALALPAAVGEETGLVRLQAEQQRAERELQALRQDIEQQRREELAVLARLRGEVEALRQQRQGLAAALTAAEQRQQQRTSAVDARDQDLRALRRLSVEHGLAESTALYADSDSHQWLQQVMVAMEQRLADLRAATDIHYEQLAVYDRQGRLQSVPVLLWGTAQRVALGDEVSTRGLLTRDDNGNWLVAGPHLPAAAQSSLGWLDMSGRLASESPRRGGLLAFVERGGPFVWPIFAIAVVGLITIIMRLLLRLRWRQPQGSAQVLLQAPDQQQALAQTTRWRGPVGHILRGILQAPPAQRQELAGAFLAEAEVHLSRGLRLLAVLAAAAPLLGLLGTVTGMIASFEALGAAAGADAEGLSAGIGQALLTTELGLLVAVPLLIIHALFARDASRWRSRCEAEALRLLSALDALQQVPTAGDQR